MTRRYDDCRDDYTRDPPPPTAEIIAIHTVAGRLRTIRVMCPYCQSTHSHPWPHTDDEPGIIHSSPCGLGQYRCAETTPKGTPHE